MTRGARGKAALGSPYARRHVLLATTVLILAAAAIVAGAQLVGDGASSPGAQRGHGGVSGLADGASGPPGAQPPAPALRSPRPAGAAASASVVPTAREAATAPAVPGTSATSAVGAALTTPAAHSPTERVPHDLSLSAAPPASSAPWSAPVTSSVESDASDGAAPGVVTFAARHAISPCPGQAPCVISGDQGVAAALNARRNAVGAGSVPVVSTPFAQRCAAQAGDCGSQYAMQNEYVLNGQAAIRDLLASPNTAAWLLSPITTSLQVGWAFDPSIGTGQYLCVLIQST